MRRTMVAAAGVVLVGVSVALVLLGRAALSTPAAVERAAAGWPDRVQVAPPRPGLADRAAADILGTDRGKAFGEIVRIYDDAVALQAAAGDPRGPVRITRLIPRLHSPEERAQALVMAGTLLAYSAGSGFGVVLPRLDQAATATVLDQALEDFRMAIRADPRNEQAKYDLELLLRQRRLQARPPVSRPKRKSTPTAQDRRQRTTRGSGQEHHAGIYATGSGY
jgi:hypothetical protein